jgi:hypothetical protein
MTPGCPDPWPAAIYPRMPPSAGKAFYVSAQSGSETNPGTLQAPWKTLQANDLRLQPGSPAIDQADAIYASPFDIDGVCRVRGSAADLGAYER